RGRVHVDRPVLEESEAIPLRDPIGDGRTMDADGTGRRLEAHPIAPKVRSAPDHYFPQDVEVEFVESIHERSEDWMALVLTVRLELQPPNATRRRGRVRVPRAFADKPTKREAPPLRATVWGIK